MGSPFLSDPWFYAVALPAVFLFGLSKGGLSGIGLLSMPLMALVVPPVTAASIMLPVLMMQDVVTVWSWRKTWDRQLVAYLLPGALVGIGIGWLSATLVDDNQVRLLVGVIAVIFGLNWVLGRTEREAAKEHGAGAGTFFGALGGYTSFVIHIGGPPFNIYALARKPDKAAFVGAYAVLFAVINVVKLPAYIGLGQMTRATVMASLVLMPLAIVSSMAGVWLVRRMPTELFFKIVYGLTLVVGLKLMTDGLRAML